jgi:hypothetical protein
LKYTWRAALLPAKRFERFCKLRTDPQVSNASNSDANGLAGMGEKQ